MLNHMSNLPLHRQHKQGNEIQEEDRPIDRHVEKIEKGHPEGDKDGFFTLVPEFELGEATGERAVFFPFVGGEEGALLCFFFVGVCVCVC